MNDKYFSTKHQASIRLWSCLLNIKCTHVTGGLCVHFSVTIKQHEDTHLQHCLSTGVRWLLDYKCSNATFERSRGHMWIKQTQFNQTTKTSQSFTCFFRLDFSVVELLDIFTPVSAPELSKPFARRPKTSQCRSALAGPKPVGRSLPTPARPCPQYTQQDLEESQILEDIFFIC